VQIFSKRLMQVGVLVFMTIALAKSAQAAGFSNASLKGGYSFLGNHWTANPNSNESARVGLWTFDGAGNWTESYTQITDGVVTTGTVSGTYTVKSNGTGTISSSDGTQLAITINSIAAGVAHGLQYLLTTDSSNEVESGTAVLQSTTAGNYSVASLKGTFGYQWNEWTANVNQPQEGDVGIVSFDGKGNVKVSYTDMLGGVLSTGTLTGTYTVNSDGSGTMSEKSKKVKFDDAFVLNSVVAGQATGLQFLNTDNNGNIVIGGIALKQ